MKVTDWDMADYIKTPEDVILYLSTALEEGKPVDVINVIGAIARSKGMTKLAKEIGVTREALYTSLSEKGNPSFITVLNVLRSMGIVLKAQKTPAQIKQTETPAIA
ncbi:MAG: addiction module antidote protein [Treponema lecithinolyticum]|uniref:addiction module antidote protein n=1 Tax=Treponema lecithinolyticum TaxID=53418 RepID=UPI003FA246D2